MPQLKEKVIDEVIDLLMRISLVYMQEGLFVKDGSNTLYFRLNQEQSEVEYVKVDNPAQFQKSSKTELESPTKIRVADIKDVTSSGESFQLVLSSRVIALTAENRTEFVQLCDGLRCLIGLTMDTPEMQESINCFSEVRAITLLYQPPPLVARPSNFNFIKAK